MKLQKSLLAMMMFAAAGAQADYRFELDAGYSTFSEEVDYDSGYYDDYDVDTDTLALGGAFYFSPVSTASGPLDEAEFLSKASGIALAYSKAEVDTENEDSVDGDSKILGGHFVIPGPNLIIEASYGQGGSDDVDVDYLSLGFGGYITDRITLVFDYSKEEYDFGSKESIDRYTLTYRQLIQLGGEMNLALEPFISKVDYFDEDAAEVGIDVAFYLNRSLGFKAGVVGFAYDADYADYSEGASYIGVDYFINETFRIGGKLLSSSGEFDADFDEDAFESEGSGVKFDLAVRF